MTGGTALTALPTALLCCRSGSRPSASASVEPDIKIVGTVAGSRDPLQRSAAGPELAGYRGPGGRQPGMGDPRHALASLPPTSLSSKNSSVGSLSVTAPPHSAGLSQHAASLSALAAQYPAHTSLPQHLMPSQAQALLQYQQLAAAALSGNQH